MKILILGADGYLGWCNVLHFAKAGHEVVGIDSKAKRFMMDSMNVIPLEIEQDIFGKLSALKKHYGQKVEIYQNDITKDDVLRQAIEKHQPDVVLHFAEQPSAPFSMIEESTGIGTVFNNLLGTLKLIYAIRDIKPDTHIIKLGTMGEYGTPNIDIEEGWLDVKHNGREDRLLFPKTPHSIYHLSKVNDSDALAFAARVWGLRVTDLNQGFVYGINTPETDETGLYPRFCYDHIFGTVLNRFITQAVVKHPLTVYGTGGQQRPMISLSDAVQCVDIAVNNPADPHEFRVFNQFTETSSVNELAELVSKITTTPIENIDNPRVESESHHYNPQNNNLKALGLTPTLLDRTEIETLFNWVSVRTNLIELSQIKPQIKWARP